MCYYAYINSTLNLWDRVTVCQKVSIWSISLSMKDTSQNHIYTIIEQLYAENPADRTLDLTLPCREMLFLFTFQKS